MLTDARFSNKLQRLKEKAFRKCISLERITIPLKDGMVAIDNTFEECGKLNHVDLVEGALLHETIAVLQLEDWREDMNEEINSIHHILLNADVGGEYDYDTRDYSSGEKTQAIRTWLRSVLRNITRYQAEHQHLLNEAASLMQVHSNLLCLEIL